MNPPNPTLPEADPETSVVSETAITEHPVAAGVGAVGGGATGAAVGMVVAGPVGSVVGALIGAVAGGFGGSAVGGLIDDPEDQTAATTTPDAEPMPWHEIIPSGLPSHDEIALRAYSYYESEGRPDGRDVDHWLAAEDALKAEVAA